MIPLYPLRFRPILRRYIWGGRRLGTRLGKPIGPESDYAESWELCDRQLDQSVVAAGPLADTTLGELVHERGRELLGRDHPQGRFPLLFKFLDSARVLSVQVHPDDAAASRLEPPDLGKTEAWVILDAQPGAVVYAGLAPGVDRAALAEGSASGQVEPLLHKFEPRTGDVLFIPAGLVHALGAGLLVAEIQQSSDVTYRLFDWNRLGPDGKPRPLHVEAALAATNFTLPPAGPQRPEPTDQPGVSRLVACDKFVLDRWTLDEPRTIGGDNRFHFLAVLRGELSVAGDAAEEPLRAGGTCLIPADCDRVLLTPHGTAEFLAIRLP